MAEIRLSRTAESDILEILSLTYSDFGGDALLRYEYLIAMALRDLAIDSTRNGVVDRPEIGPGVHSYHLRHSRQRARHATGLVHRPRHMILFRHIHQDRVGVGRILHDAMEIERHVPSQFGDE